MDPRRTPTRLALVRLAIAAGSWRLLVRAIAVLLGLRRLSPAPGAFMPSADQGGQGDAGDTGGGGWFRPAWRKQDPAADPREPGGGESSGAGNDHGWSNCTMASGAMALAFDTQAGDRFSGWGGDLRHHQGDLSGGTDLGDLADAWRAYGRTLTIRSGAGWSALLDDLGDGRAVVVQGEGNVPGSSTFDGGHACVISPETRSGDDFLFGDPLASGWQWVSRSSVRSWMEAWAGSGLAWARSSAHPPAGPPPDPDPTPPPADKTPFDQGDVDRAAAQADAAGYQRGLAAGATAAADAFGAGWMGWLDAPAAGPADTWDVGAWSSLADRVGIALVADPDPCPPVPGDPAAWARGPVPPPVSWAHQALAVPAAWDSSGWTAAAWRAG